MTPFKEIFERYYTWLEGYSRNVRRFAAYPPYPGAASPPRPP